MLQCRIISRCCNVELSPDVCNVELSPDVNNLTSYKEVNNAYLGQDVKQ